MRREEIPQESYIDWLKSLGCVVYLPLNYNGDLYEYISGNQLIINNNRVIWNDLVGMYLFYAGNNQASPAASVTTICNSSTFSNGVLSILSNIKRGPARGVIAGANCAWNENNRNSNNVYTADSINWIDGDNLILRATVLDKNVPYRKWYTNGELIRIDQLDSVISDIHTLNIVSYSGWGVSNANVYESNIMIFNTALDLQTIRKIQGYE